MTDSARFQEELLALDARIADLIEERAKRARDAGDAGDAATGGIPFDPRRSLALAGRLPSLPEAAARRLFDAYFAALDPLVRPRTLAVVDADGARAALTRHGDDGALLVAAASNPRDALAEALGAVASGRADGAVLRYQRPGEGPIAETLDAIAASEGRIVHLFDGEDAGWAIVALRPAPKSGVDRTGFLIRVQDTPGVLQDVLGRFAAHRVNLTKIHSYPAKEGDYRFYLECDGHASDRPLVAAIDEVRKLARQLCVLGSYVRPDARS